ncbi:MAG: N-acetyltransferase [Proteobacteria bacterium]|nr:MAG: N-acetyltransferase [Pseudomonadota bacterium]
MFSILKFEEITGALWQDCFEFYRQISEESYPHREFSHGLSSARNLTVSEAFAMGLDGFFIISSGKIQAACHYRYDHDRNLVVSEVKFLRSTFNPTIAEYMENKLVELCRNNLNASLQMVVENEEVHSFYRSNGKFHKVGEVVESVLELANLNQAILNSWLIKDAAFEVRSVQWSDPKELRSFVTVFNETGKDVPFQDAEGIVKNRSLEYFMERAEKSANRNRIWLRYGLFMHKQLVGIILFEGQLDSPRTLYIEATGIQREYRGRGLGKFLKAASTIDLSRKFPSLRYLATGNEESNAPMLRINRSMGFIPRSFFTMLRYRFE